MASGTNGKEHSVTTPPINEAELAAILKRAGLNLTADQVKGILPGATIFQGMLARVNAPLPREAEPAVTFDVLQARGEQG
jgi:hypothetical protein